MGWGARGRRSGGDVRWYTFRALSLPPLERAVAAFMADVRARPGPALPPREPHAPRAAAAREAARAELARIAGFLDQLQRFVTDGCGGDLGALRPPTRTRRRGRPPWRGRCGSSSR